MKILLWVDDYLPSTKSAPVMMQQLGLAMTDLGHQVTILTPSETVPGTYEIDSDGPLQVIRFRSGRLKNINFVQRALNELLLPWCFRKAFCKIKEFLIADYIVYYSPTIFFGLGIRMLKKEFNCPACMILRDIFPQWAVDNKILHSWSPVTYFFRIFERINYRAADVIAVQSPGNISYFKNSVFRNKITVVYNWFDPDFVHHRGSGLREKYQLEHKVIFFYGGNIGHAQDMDNLVRLARNLRDFPEAFFIFVGKGDEYDLVKQRIAEYDLKNLLLLPAVDQTEYFKLLDQIDVGLFSLHPDHKTQNFPGKLLGYMAYSKPILGSVNKSNDVQELINNSGAGFVAVNPDDEVLAEAARRMLQPEERMKMQKNAFKLLIKSFNLRTICQQIIDCKLRFSPKTGQLDKV